MYTIVDFSFKFWTASPLLGLGHIYNTIYIFSSGYWWKIPSTNLLIWETPLCVLNPGGEKGKKISSLGVSSLSFLGNTWSNFSLILTPGLKRIVLQWRRQEERYFFNFLKTIFDSVINRCKNHFDIIVRCI